MQEESQAPGEGGGSLKSHEEVERQYLPPYLLQILEEQWVASLAPWVSLQINWLKPLPGGLLMTNHLQGSRFWAISSQESMYGN